jgi:hypothetical protein
LGVEPAVKSMLFTFVPTRPFREGGTLRSTWKGSGHTTAFLRLDEIPRAVCLWTKGLDDPEIVEAPVCAYAADHFGDNRP